MSANPVAARRQNYSAKMRREGLPPIWPSCRSCCASPDCTGLPAVAAGWHTHYRPVENRWKSSGKHVGGAKNKHGVVLIWLPRRRTRNVSACGYGPVLQIFQSDFGQGLFLVQTVLLLEHFSTR